MIYLRRRCCLAALRFLIGFFFDLRGCLAVVFRLLVARWRGLTDRLRRLVEPAPIFEAAA